MQTRIPHPTPTTPRSLASLALACAIASGLNACGSSAPQQESNTAATASAAPAATTVVAQAPRERAAAALRAERIFLPRGENAFELYLEALALDPRDTLSRNALLDLMPYAVMQVEQRLTSRNLEDAAHLLALMRRADATAPALPRLTQALQRAQQAAEEQARAAVAETRVAAAAPATASTPPSAPIPTKPVASAPVEPAKPSSATNESVAAKPSVDATSAPGAPTLLAAVAPASLTPPPSPAAVNTMPVVKTQVPPRYPPQAMRRRLEGRVELEFTIQADGSVSDVAVLSSHPEGVFERAAISAMQRWRYAPSAKSIRAHRAFDFRMP